MGKEICIEMRRQMKKEVLPEAVRFTEAVFPWLDKYDIDKLDTVEIEESVILDKTLAIFKLVFDPLDNKSFASCRFHALTADDAGVLVEMQNALKGYGFEGYSIEYIEIGEQYDDDERTSWTLMKSFEIVKELFDGFQRIYEEVKDAGRIIIKTYKNYAAKNRFLDRYLIHIGLEPRVKDVFEIEMTAPVWADKAFMTEYERTVIDGFSSIMKVNTSAGCARSIFHGNDVVARFYYVSPGVYILKPVELFFEDESEEFLYVLAEEDGSYTFFTNTKSWAAMLDNSEKYYQILIRYDLKELIPFIGSVEELVFEPDEYPEAGEADEEEMHFLLMNEQVREAKKMMRKDLGFEDDLSLLRSPAIDLYSFLEREGHAAFESNKPECNAKLIDELFFIQNIKDRCYGIDSGDLTERYYGRSINGRQMTMSDFL